MENPKAMSPKEIIDLIVRKPMGNNPLEKAVYIASRERLSSALQSLLYWVAEQLKTDFPTAWKTMVTNKENHHEKCSWRRAGMLCDCAGQEVFIATTENCRAVILAETNKLT